MKTKKKTIEMAKKKQKKHMKEKEQRKPKKAKVKDYIIEVSHMQSDVKTFIENFKSDVANKRKAYQSYAQKLSKKKTSAR